MRIVKYYIHMIRKLLVEAVDASGKRGGERGGERSVLLINCKEKYLVSNTSNYIFYSVCRYVNSLLH